MVLVGGVLLDGVCLGLLTTVLLDGFVKWFLFWDGLMLGLFTLVTLDGFVRWFTKQSQIIPNKNHLTKPS